MSLENQDLIKGLGQVMTQDMFRAVTDKSTGMIGLNPVKMVNVCFAKHDKDGKVYMFINPSDKRLCKNTKISVKTRRGISVAYVVSSVKIQRKYLRALGKAIGNPSNKYTKVIGVYESGEETFTELGVDNEQQSQSRINVQSN